MPKVNVYVPEEMYEELRRRHLPVSQIAQEAFSKAITEDENPNAEWIARILARPRRRYSVTTEELMAAVDEEEDEDWDEHLGLT